jgi:hypothetical protein
MYYTLLAYPLFDAPTAAVARGAGDVALETFAIIALSLTRVVHAEELDIPASRDTTLYQESASLANGAGDYIFAGATDTPYVRRALVRFDVTAIPRGSTITSASLTLFCSRTKTQNETVSIARVTSDWGEAASHAADEEGAGAAALAGDATWRHRFFDTTFWNTPGGDFVASPSASTVVGGQNSLYSWSSAAMAADVQGWVDGAEANFAWIMLGNEAETRVVKRFNSRTSADVAKRPRHGPSARFAIATGLLAFALLARRASRVNQSTP